MPLSPRRSITSASCRAFPPSGADRLAFFQEYLEHEDPLLAQDAYDEFARAPYAEVQALGPQMHHDRLVKWITDPEVSPSRRRLYLTMLGVCGTKDDLPLLESMIVSDFNAMKPHLRTSGSDWPWRMGGPIGLPRLGRAGRSGRTPQEAGARRAGGLLPHAPRPGRAWILIDDRFLKNPNTEYTYIYSTIMALRFHGDEPSSKLPRERLLASMRLLLDNPEFADQVIPDLSRWEDWSVLDRLVAMFKTSDKNGYVRQPVVTYLTVASEQPGDVGTRAQTALTELEQLDPEGVKQARSLMAFGALGRARASTPAATADTTKPSTEAADSSTVPADATKDSPLRPPRSRKRNQPSPPTSPTRKASLRTSPLTTSQLMRQANAVDAVESNADASTKSEPVSTPAAPVTETAATVGNARCHQLQQRS